MEKALTILFFCAMLGWMYDSYKRKQAEKAVHKAYVEGHNDGEASEKEKRNFNNWVESYKVSKIRRQIAREEKR